MKKKHIFGSAALVALSILAAGCSSDDTTPAYDSNTLTTFTGGSEDGEDPTTTRSSMRVEELREEGAPDNALTRTSVEYTKGTANVPFYWDWADVIWVKDDNGKWNRSVNSLKGKYASTSFDLTGSYLNNNKYTVHYTGGTSAGSKSATSVVIKNVQGRVNTGIATVHMMGYNGDCAVGEATKVSQGKYQFTVTHKAAYLFFSPTGSTDIENNYSLKEVKVSSNKDIAGTYDFTNGTLASPTNPSTQITFDGVYNNTPLAFSEVVNNKNLRMHFAIVIAPGTEQTLTITYTLVNKTDSSKTMVVTKKYKMQDFIENTIYNVPVNFTTTN